jgi:hypothetical protein
MSESRGGAATSGAAIHILLHELGEEQRVHAFVFCWESWNGCTGWRAALLPRGSTRFVRTGPETPREELDHLTRCP